MNSALQLPDSSIILAIPICLRNDIHDFLGLLFKFFLKRLLANMRVLNLGSLNTLMV